MIYKAHNRTILASVLALTLAFAASHARAATIHVAAGEEAVAANGLCSLREAIHNVNADAQVDNTDCAAGSGADTIELAAASTYTLSDADPVDSDSGLADLTSAVVVNGNAATIQRDTAVACTLANNHLAGQFRLFTITSGGDVTLNDLAVLHGCANRFSGKGNDGGAIFIKDASLVLDHVTVADSRASDKSGGLDTADSTITIRYSRFIGNTAGGGGGGIGNGKRSSMTILRSAVAHNSAGGDGGGGIGNFGTLLVVNSTLSGNATTSTGGGGGGIGNGGVLDVVNSTVSGNASSGVPGGGGIGNVGTARIKNSIVANSTAGGDCFSQSTPGSTFSAFGDNRDSDGSCTALSPNFIQATPAQIALGTLADNGGPTQTLALGRASVAIDAVTDCTDLDGMAVSSDQRGASRPQHGACDIGAYESNQVCYVNAGAIAGANTGASWSDAYTDLQSTLVATAQCNEIWVAAGVYKPTSGSDPTISFAITSGMALYGGFAGTETARDQRQPMLDATVLSGDVDNNDSVDAHGVDASYTDIQGVNSYNVVSMDGRTDAISEDTSLDGFTITGGDAQGAFPSNGGGGLLCNASGSGACGPVLSNLSFSGNNSGDVGGAVYLLGNGAEAGSFFFNITFSGNHAASSGGALYNDGSSGGTSSPWLTNVTFNDNHAGDSGGAMYNDGSDSGNSSPHLINATFTGNSALENGGAIFSVTGNGSSKPVLINVILWNDSAADAGAEMFNINATPSINNSIVQGGDAGSNTGNAFSTGSGNIDADPLLAALDDNGGYTRTLALAPASPAVQAGDNSTCPATDQRGIARPQGPHCDIGAYELSDLIFADGFEASP